MSLELKILDLGRKSYGEAWEVQKKMFGLRKANEISDSLILVEHTPTISFGINEEWNRLHVSEEELKNEGIDFVRSDRGGGAAYLGPGQLVGYTILDIKKFGSVLPFMKALEDVMIRTALDFGIMVKRYDVMNPTTDKPYRATWYKNGNEKPEVLCTKGIKVALNGTGMYTHHGFALNVNKVEPNYFHFIDPCGFPVDEVKPIYMNEIVKKELDFAEVKRALIRNFKDVLGYPEAKWYL